ncbi:AFG2-interacting ribosome maturation factor-like [Lineus longissimus]|uniref:AFG2-interacting ribosome maturation factor-like n=1 Tax=Lineus longissimus TaxID=88925 RepID=UPI002B4D7951
MQARPTRGPSGMRQTVPEPELSWPREKMQAEVALSQQLNRSFKVIKKNLSLWDQTLLEGRPCVDSISNLAEQLECCQRVKVSATPLKNFENLQERLIGKLISTIEDEIIKFIELQQQLQDVSDRLSKENDKCVTLYQCLRVQLPVEVMVSRMPFRPSYADMLEMIRDVDRICHELSATRSYHWDQLDYNKPAVVQEVMTSLKKTNKLQDQMEETLAKVQFFLDDSFSTEMDMPAFE